ncbi:MAG: hypothetical protein DME65_04925 [Verrucomicrobia bacterium]|nr:MAG: hypothetical protein DME65_04925 [Verrucomicrobiota bacterium]
MPNRDVLMPHLPSSAPRLPRLARLSVGFPARRIQRAAIARAFTKARTESTICFGVVAQSHTLIRITALPCRVEPPHQHSPERWMFSSVALVKASSSHKVSTWLKTTSLWI